MNVSKKEHYDEPSIMLKETDFLDNELADDRRATDVCVVLLTPDKGSISNEINLSDASVAKQIESSLAKSGAVLLRGCGLKSIEQAEQLLSSLGTKFDDQYLGGASPRSRLSDHFFTSTEAPAPYVISFHTEMCYLRERPGKIFFYCVTAPRKYGETPVFDCVKLWQNLPEDLQEKIERLGVIYQRYFVAKKSRFLNVYKTWMDAFNVTTKEQAEATCIKQGLTFEWQADGGLVTRSQIPGVLRHPQSGQKCLSLTLYNSEAAPYDMRLFANRINPVARFLLGGFMRLQYARNNVFMRTLWGDGTKISAAETRQILDLANQTCTLFRWQKNDLLLLDNIRSGHGRLNVVKPRMIAAALGDTYQL